MARLEPLMGRNFIEYASYVIVDRAIPDLRDGLKPVQRRILATLRHMDDGSFHKVANVIGETMKLHPHGDASIGEALVVLANKELFIEKQGNFGSPVTGHPAAAPRYIECRLSDLARETLFSKALLETGPSYDGRSSEPTFLPAKLPVVLLLGIEGIAVGMATRILPHNFREVLEAQIRLLSGRETKLLPDFPTGGIVDVSEYDDGRGRVRVRARIEATDEHTIVIREIPFTTTTENLIASIEAAAQKGKVQLREISDYTTEKVEIEIGLPRGVTAAEVIPQLLAHTDCEVTVSSNIVVISGRRPVEMTVSEVLRFLTDQLSDQIRRELQHEIAELVERRHRLSLERLFIEKKVYKRIEQAATEEAVRGEVRTGLEPFREHLERDISDEDITHLLGIPIRRISAFDLAASRRNVDAVTGEIAVAKDRLRHLKQTTISYLENLLAQYRDRFPRRCEIRTFDAVDVRSLAQQNIKLSYDPATGFFGTEVKGSEHQLSVSEYDRILIVCADGSYRVVAAEPKILLPGKPLHLGLFDQENGHRFTVIYRDSRRMAFAKRVHIQTFVRDREYDLVKGREGKIDLLLPGDADGILEMRFVPAKRQRVHAATFDLARLGFVGLSARGSRLAPKPVATLKLVKRREPARKTPRNGRNGAPTSELTPGEQQSLF